MEIPIIRNAPVRRREFEYSSRLLGTPNSNTYTTWPRNISTSTAFGSRTGHYPPQSSPIRTGVREDVAYRRPVASRINQPASRLRSRSTSRRTIDIPIETSPRNTFHRSHEYPETGPSSFSSSVGRLVTRNGTHNAPSGGRGFGPSARHGMDIWETNPRISYGPVTYHTYDTRDAVTDRPADISIPITTRDTPKESPKEDEEKVATIVKVDAKVLENARAHHTDQFHVVDSGGLVIRRGQVFELTISLDRKFIEGKDNLKFVFETGTQPLPGKGTLVSCTLMQSDASGQWRAKMSRSFGNDVNVAIETGANAIVGDWRLMISMVSKSGRQQSSTEIPVYILFNPWCREDSVYFPDQAKLSEYVLNDNGCIFFGTHNQIGANPWFFGQFESGILEAAIFCLNKAFKSRPSQSLGDPVQVSRAISKIVNSNDDKGVVVGNWSGSYYGGKAPLSWTGSVEILRQFMKKRSPVKYGQCYVFSGVVTTICRALGIPCRSVTNFSSAHDTDASVSIDVHWDAGVDGDNSLEHLNTDSIWNFHVWNDVWMRRPDLSTGNDGWQVLDATPQERSNGTFQCGPSPLTAVRAGQCDIQYDTPFIFAEVNADRVHWGRAPNGDWEVIDVEKSVVGKNISTKVPDGRPILGSLTDCKQYREDITQQYKYPDESERERIAVINAGRTSTTNRIPLHSRKKADVKLTIQNHDYVLVGSDFESTISFENTSRDVRTVVGKVICDLVSYTGHKISTCREEKVNLGIEPRTVQSLQLKVAAQDYLQYMNESAIVKISVIVRVKETGATAALVDNFRLRIPDLQIKMLATMSYVGTLLQFRVNWKNPLNKKLTNAVLHVECPGMEDEVTVPLGSIGACQDVSTIVGCRVGRPGLKQIYVTMECDQLQNVKGVADIFVQGR